ncbi:MAG: tRNA-binding protein [Bacteroidia bacterium]|nr:tRNA-binding protein [Bacteroidia bacterium]
MIDFSDFLRVEIRAGQILRAEPFPEARKPAYKLWIDFGELGEKKTSAQITDLYTLEDLPGKFIVAVTNFPPKQVGKFMSEVLVLGVVGESHEVVLLQPDRPVKPGQRVF